MCGEKKERILLWQDPEEDQEAAALEAALAEAEALAVEAASAAAALAVEAWATDRIITIIMAIGARAVIIGAAAGLAAR